MLLHLLLLFQVHSSPLRSQHTQSSSSPTLGTCRSGSGAWRPSHRHAPTHRASSAETLFGYDCSLFPLSSFLPFEMPDYMRTMPFCERIPDQSHHQQSQQSQQVQSIPLHSFKFEWQPSSCTQLLPFNKTDFAKLLSKSPAYPTGRTISILGDSVQEEMWISLVCLLGKEMIDETSTRLEIEKKKIELYESFGLKANELLRKRGVVILKNGGRIQWLRHNFITSENSGSIEDNMIKIDTSSPNIPYRYMKKELPWTKEIQSFNGKGDVLLFNTGAHGKLTRQRVQTILFWFKTHFSGTLIYRQNVPGDERCSTQKDDIIHQYAKEWRHFNKYDQWWHEESLKILKSPQRLHVLDIRYLSMERPAHPGVVFGEMDCLHFCLPGGPPDVWSMLLYNEIRKQEGSE